MRWLSGSYIGLLDMAMYYSIKADYYKLLAEYMIADREAYLSLLRRASHTTAWLERGEQENT